MSRATQKDSYLELQTKSTYWQQAEQKADACSCTHVVKMCDVYDLHISGPGHREALILRRNTPAGLVCGNHPVDSV